ncbi:MAG: hypothetical protein PHY29_02850 [Syntrophales bacterium]|nr:hypothetical protein [Syntrophales bacterium]
MDCCTNHGNFAVVYEPSRSGCPICEMEDELSKLKDLLEETRELLQDALRENGALQREVYG